MAFHTVEVSDGFVASLVSVSLTVVYVGHSVGEAVIPGFVNHANGVFDVLVGLYSVAVVAGLVLVGHFVSDLFDISYITFFGGGLGVNVV